VHEIKLDGFRMAARIDNGRVQLLTRTGLDWTGKYPSVIAALAQVTVKTAYIDGELCGVDEAGLPSFARTQVATDGERGVHLVYYAFDLLYLGGRDVSTLQLIERKALLEPLLKDKPGLQFNGHEAGDGELILKHAGKLGFEGVVSKTTDAPLRAGKPRPMAKSQSAQSARVRRCGLVGPGRHTASSRGAAARLLHR
jgi:bifunctional non-homologous end joining protein LigD